MDSLLKAKWPCLSRLCAKAIWLADARFGGDGLLQLCRAPFRGTGHGPRCAPPTTEGICKELVRFTRIANHDGSKAPAREFFGIDLLVLLLPLQALGMQGTTPAI